jgi:hypothetical protein
MPASKSVLGNKEVIYTAIIDSSGDIVDNFAGEGGGGEGGLTDAELRATAVPVSIATAPVLVAGDANIGNVDVVSLPALAAGTNNIGDVDVLTVIPGVAATSLGKAEDAAHTTGDTGVMMLAVRSDTATASGAAGDYVPLLTDDAGQLWVNVGEPLPAGTNNIGDVDVLSMVPGTGATALGKAEDAVHASGDTGVMALAVRRDTATAVAADGDYIPLTAGARGSIHMNVESWGGTAVDPLDSDPVPVSSTDLGTTADAAVTNPASSASLISLAKGWLTGLGAVADAAWTSGSGSVIALLKAIAGGIQVFSPGDMIDVTLSLDTSAYASGDILADTQSIANAVRVNAGRALLQSVTIIDEDDQGVALTLYFLSANNSLGSENAAPSITDANARDILGWVDFGTADYKDLGGSKIACKTGIGLLLEAASASTTLYVAAVNGTGTPTYTASGLKLKLGLIWA